MCGLLLDGEAPFELMGVKRRRAFGEILLALGLLAASGLAAVAVMGLFPGNMRVPVLMLVQGVVVLLGLRGLLALRAQRWADIGLGSLRASDPGRGFLAFGACMVSNLLLTSFLFVLVPEAVQSHLDGLGALAAQVSGGVPVIVMIALLCFVGVYEELFARGFLLSRCRELLGGVWGPVLLSSFLFGWGHAYQGWIGVAQTSLVGVVLAAFTIRWRTLWPAIIAHAALDITSIAMLGVAESDI